MRANPKNGGCLPLNCQQYTRKKGVAAPGSKGYFYLATGPKSYRLNNILGGAVVISCFKQFLPPHVSIGIFEECHAWNIPIAIASRPFWSMMPAQPAQTGIF